MEKEKFFLNLREIDSCISLDFLSSFVLSIIPEVVHEALPFTSFHYSLQVEQDDSFLLLLSEPITSRQVIISGSIFEESLNGIYSIETEERISLFFFSNGFPTTFDEDEEFERKEKPLLLWNYSSLSFFQIFYFSHEGKLEQIVSRNTLLRRKMIEKFVDEYSFPISCHCYSFDGRLLFLARTENDRIPLLERFSFLPCSLTEEEKERNLALQKTFSLQLTEELKENSTSYLLYTTGNLLDLLAPFDIERSLEVYYSCDGMIVELILNKNRKRISLIEKGKKIHFRLLSYL